MTTEMQHPKEFIDTVLPPREGVAKALEEQITNLIWKHPDLRISEAILALCKSIGLLVLNTDCPHCRERTNKAVKELMPQVMRDALREARERVHLPDQHRPH